MINASKHDTSEVFQNTIQTTEQRINILRSHASALYKEILALMLTREKSSTNPKAKLIIRTKPPSSVSSAYEPIENAIIRVEGNCFDISGLSETSQPLSWPEFTAKAEADTVFQWRKALTSLISSSQASKFLDDNSIVSFDRKKLFRIFTSSVRQYYSNESECDIFVIEILPTKDYGNSETTLLLKALEIGLGYRFMFLEQTSEFSPALFSATKLEDFQLRVSAMTDRLHMLLLKADEYKLNDPVNIIRILGLPASGNIDDQYKIWDSERVNIYDASKKIMKTKNVDDNDKKEFIQVLSSFCEHTREMNINYTTAVLRGLENSVLFASPRCVNDAPESTPLKTECF